MDTFEINSLLRLLRSSVKGEGGGVPNAAATSVNFIDSGQRFETLKSLHKQVKRRLSASPSSLCLQLVHSTLKVLKSLLSSLVCAYYSSLRQPEADIRPSNIAVPIITPLKFPAKRATDNVFASAVRRNEILEIIRIVIEVLLKSPNQATVFVESEANQAGDSYQQDSYGRVFLPEIISLLGHQSTDVQRYSIRFLQLFITQTSNLQKMMHAYVVYGLESPILSVQFGSLNALSHLFIRPEMRAENLNPLICSLARILVRTQSANPHLFYPTYTTLERFNALLGAKRFFSFLCDSEIPNIAVLYENIQKRAPSPRIFIEASGSIPTAPLQRADRNYADREERIVRLPPLAPTTQLINHDSHWFDAGGSGQCGRRSSDQQWKPGSTGHLSPSAVTTTTANRQSGQCRPPVSRKRGIKPLSVDPEPKRLVVATTATTPAHEPGQDNSNKTCTRKGTHVSQRVSFADPDSLDSHSSKRPIRATSEPAKSVQLTATRNVPSVKSTSPLEANLPAQTQPVQKESEMTASTTYLPGLANYSSLDADSLANLDYIPTMKSLCSFCGGHKATPLAGPTRWSGEGVSAVPSGLDSRHQPLMEYCQNYYHPYAYPHLYGLYHSTDALAPAVDHYPNRQLLRFSILPRVLVYQALSSLAEEQFAAVQAIVRIVRDTPHEHLLLLIPHMDEFLSVFISQLLLDSASNFKVILWTLDIVELLSERLKHRLEPYLSQIVFLLSRRLGDNRIVIRDSVIKVFHQLMTRYSAQEMLDLLFKHVSSDQHTPLAFTSSSKLREELANRITATVSLYPRTQLNLPKLCFDVAPLLTDRRSRVRLASLECVATLAQALGPHKLCSLMTAVHSLDATLSPIDLDRLVAAIQARLARRSLPRTRPDGNVQYVLRVPNTGEQPWYYRRIYDADLEWIALGPTTPPSKKSPPALGTGPGVPPYAELLPPDSSEASSENNCCSGAGLGPRVSEEEMLSRQTLVKSADSEDIPPPVRSKVVSRSVSPGPVSTCHKSHYNQINPDSMSNDQQSLFRNFHDTQQQVEMESRCRSLERSKTSQDFRPYGSKYDHFLDRFYRGESIDDSDLIDAHLRKSSVESLEAWRQYFGRFKKQMAEMALNGGTRFYGSRPTSGAFYGSPFPVSGLSPAHYYYYYCNGLSHSYHDLSQLQQQNMMSIMRRSGFLPDDPTVIDNQTDETKPGITVESTEEGYKPHLDQNSPVGPGRMVGTATEQSQSPVESPSPKQAGDESFPLERSLSMPAIGPRFDASNENLDTSSPNEEVISEEVIQELGMWDQVIQEEKKESKSMEMQREEGKAGGQQEEPKGSSTVQRASSSKESKEQTKIRKQSVIPVVNIQPNTPNLESDGESQQMMASSSPEYVSENEENSAYEAETGGKSVTFQTSVNSSVETDLPDDRPEVERQSAQKGTKSPEEESKQECLEKESPQEAKSGEKKSATALVSKSGIPAPPARRLSQPAQQLYIKTTPAIPMNANIQHILTNVARTEGPFEYPAEAVKAALVALHDNAWTTKVEGMLAVVRLATFHPHFLLRDQHQIALALVTEVRNLRSTVSRSAIFTIGELFSKLKSQIEPELDILVQSLMYKVGENSVFIREDIDRALTLMVEKMPQTRAAISLVTFGSNHRNTFVRRTCAQFLSALVGKMGAMKCLLGPRDIGEFILPAAARFIQDGSPHTRYFGRRMFAVLMQHPSFDKMLRRHVSPGTYRNICGMLETIKRRGIGDKPADLYTPSVQPKKHDPRKLVVVGGATPTAQ